MAGLAALLAVSFGPALAPALADSGLPTSTGAAASAGPAVWTDFFGDGTLTPGLVDLISRAARRSTINVKSYFFFDDGPAPRRIISALHTAATHRDVHVNVLVQKGDAYSRAQWKAFRKALDFANVQWCQRSCTADPVDGSVSHSKFFTFSNIAGPLTSAVVETSANITQQQLDRTIQSAVVFAGNSAAYDAFSAEFQRNQACADGDCPSPTAPVAIPLDSATSVYFAPFTGRGPWTSEVRGLVAQPGCQITLMSIRVHDLALTNALNRLRDDGCDVRVAVEHRRVDDNLDALTPRLGTNHEKLLLIHNGTRDVVYAGSLDFSYGAEHDNNQQMLASTDPTVLGAYQQWADRIWAATPAT